jgi:hypothetical protein
VRDAAVLEAASHGKYTLLRTQQLLRSNDEVMLMPGVKRPVLEALDGSKPTPTLSGEESESSEASTVNW